MKSAYALILMAILWLSFLGMVKAEPAIDVDLSACSRGITYAQMIQVCRTPESFEGKLFRLKGKFNYSPAREEPRIIFSDNAGCCEIMLVFLPAQTLTYPDDYPALYGDIMITARLAVDRSNPDMPCWFTDAVIE